MRDFPEFKTLTIYQRAELLCKHGEFICGRKYKNYKVSLYAMQGNYVEVWLSPKKEDIESIEVITDSNILDLYLVNISLKKLF